MIVVGSRDLQVRSQTNQVNLALFFYLSLGPWVFSCVWLTSNQKLILHISLFITCFSGECFSVPSSSKSAFWGVKVLGYKRKINKHGERKKRVLRRRRRRRKERKQGEVHHIFLNDSDTTPGYTSTGPAYSCWTDTTLLLVPDTAPILLGF